MPPRKKSDISHQQNIWIATDYGLQLWKSNGNNTAVIGIITIISSLEDFSLYSNASPSDSM